jgi:leucine dehydrogenase
MTIELQKKSNKPSIKKISDFIFEKLDIEGYEDVYKITNEKSKLLAIISIHDTTLGCALGGIRIYSYPNFEKALEDALRLSKGMTYKSAVAEAGFGGGKSVIIVNSIKDKTEDLLTSFGEAVDLLKGKYICAEDMGCSPQDMLVIKKKTKYVVGLPLEKSSGDPSGFTAWGVFRGIQATLNKLYGSTSVADKKIAIQGLGNVGMHLADYLFWHGADLILTDIDEEKAKRLATKYGAKAVKAENIYKEKCDIFSPCAIGGIINDNTIPHLQCKAICGCANNQLLEDRHCDLLKEKNIIYAPDFVVNAGGLINVANELDKEGYHPKTSREKIHKLYEMINEIYKIADDENISTNQAAIKLAQYKIKCGIGRRKQLYFHHFE